MFDPKKYVSESVGSVWVLVDCYYPGPQKYKPGFAVKGSESWECNYLLLLFSHKNKAGDITNRFRRMIMKPSCEEFCLFYKAYFEEYLAENAHIDHGAFFVDFSKDIAANDYNFRIQFDPEVPHAIKSIQKLAKPLELRSAGMLWQRQAVEMYPEIKGQNESLENTFGTLMKRPQVKKAMQQLKKEAV